MIYKGKIKIYHVTLVLEPKNLGIT